MKSRQSASSDTAAIDARELSLNGVVGTLGADAAAVATVAVDRADALTLRLDSSFVVHIRGMCRAGGRLVSCARETARRTVLCASDGRSVGCVGMVFRRQPTGPSSCTAAPEDVALASPFVGAIGQPHSWRRKAHYCSILAPVRAASEPATVKYATRSAVQFSERSVTP